MSPILSVEGFDVDAQIGTTKGNAKWGDVARAFSGKLRLDIRATHRTYRVTTVPLSDADAEALEQILATPGALECSGDQIGTAADFHASNINVRPLAGALSVLSFDLTEADDGSEAVLLFSFDTDSHGSYTFTRNTPATYNDSDGVVQIARANVPRFHYIDVDEDQVTFEEEVLLLEAARTNLNDDDDLTAWAGAATVTSGVTDPAGGTAAFTVEDSSAAATQIIVNDVSGFMDLAVNSAAFVVRENTMPASGDQHLRIRDTTAGANRLLLAISGWTNGEPTVSASGGTYLGKLYVGNGYWALFGQTTSALIEANTNQFQVYPANTTAETGKLDVYRVMAFADDVPPISIFAAAEARAEDSIFFDYTHAIQAMSIYYDIPYWTAPDGEAVTVLYLGSSTGAEAPYLQMTLTGASGNSSATWDGGGDVGSVGSSVAAGPAWGDRVEALLTLTAAGVVQFSMRLNAGTTTTATSAAGDPVTVNGGAFAGQRFYFNEVPGTAITDVMSYKKVRVYRGVKTMDEAANLARARLHVRTTPVTPSVLIATRSASPAGVGTATVSLTKV